MRSYLVAIVLFGVVRGRHHDTSTQTQVGNCERLQWEWEKDNSTSYMINILRTPCRSKKKLRNTKKAYLKMLLIKQCYSWLLWGIGFISTESQMVKMFSAITPSWRQLLVIKVHLRKMSIFFFFNYFGRTSGEFEQQTFSLVFLLSEDSQQNCATQRFSFPQNCSER